MRKREEESESKSKSSDIQKAYYFLLKHSPTIRLEDGLGMVVVKPQTLKFKSAFFVFGHGQGMAPWVKLILGKTLYKIILAGKGRVSKRLRRFWVKG